MQKKINFIKSSFLFYAFFICYLLTNTGIISDDFDAMITNNKFYFLETPVQYLTNFVWYNLFNINTQTALNLLKISFIFLSFYFITKFFKIYLDTQGAVLASFLFVFFPSHDSTVYCFMIQYLTLSFAFYLYSFYLAYYNRLSLAFLFALFASFISYGSTPIAIALFILFLLNKEFKKGLVIIIPNIIYCLYFIPLNILMRLGSPRIIEKLSISSLMKQFILQILSFIDATFGPSMWLKIYFSFVQLSAVSVIIGIVLTVIFYKTIADTGKRYDKKVIFSFAILLLFSFLILSLTGRYPQLAFNLGNRTTIFGSLLITYLIVLIPVSKKIKTLIAALMIFTILGISDHWKQWSLNQEAVIANIIHNQELKNYRDSKIIYVSGNQYSRYGPISNIEFLSEDWVVNAVFKLALGNDISAASLNKRHKYINGYLVDSKYNRSRIVTNYINVYNTDNNKLFRLKIEDINDYIGSLPSENRHWIQLSNIKFINEALGALMPRLRYALQ